MLKDITLGQYFPGDSAIHRMDPRMKLILTIVYIVGVFMVSNLPGYLLALAFLYLVVRISGIKFSYLVKGVKPLRFIILFTFVLNLFFVQGETPIFSLGFFTLTKEALNNAIFVALRLVFLVMGTSVLTLTTSPVQLTDGLERLMHPLQRFHFPAHELAMMMTIALRFIPTLLEETDKIQKAQMARGACRCSSARSAGRTTWPWPWRRAAIAAATTAPACASCATRGSTSSARWPRRRSSRS